MYKLPQETTAQVLLDYKVPLPTVADLFKNCILEKLRFYREQGCTDEEAYQALFPNTLTEEYTLSPLVSALVAGSHVLIFGPPGVGKTSLAKDIWNLFPKTVWAVADCPVLDNPLSLIDKKFFAHSPPCPFCKINYGKLSYSKIGDFDTSLVEPSSVKVRYVRLREGAGFARIQGSSEVFPDHLTGNINLHKLEKIGDPSSPLVLEPGKLLQANRGILLVDEVGKLPYGSQNVLLQALQENTVSPAKSRETFPAEFIAITTSNLADLDNINEPLNDRLISIHMDFNKSHAKNRAIVDANIKGKTTVFLPDIYLETGIGLIELWRAQMTDNVELSEVGSNRTTIDIAERMNAYADIANRAYATAEDFKKGLRDAMLGRIRARSGDSYLYNKNLVEKFIAKNLELLMRKHSAIYWCAFFKHTLKGDVAAGNEVLKECRRLFNDKTLVEDVKTAETGFEKFRLFAKFVAENEKYLAINSVDAALQIFGVLEGLKVFECKKEDFE